ARVQDLEALQLVDVVGDHVGQHRGLGRCERVHHADDIALLDGGQHRVGRLARRLGTGRAAQRNGQPGRHAARHRDQGDDEPDDQAALTATGWPATGVAARRERSVMPLPLVGLLGELSGLRIGAALPLLLLLLLLPVLLSWRGLPWDGRLLLPLGIVPGVVRAPLSWIRHPVVLSSCRRRRPRPSVCRRYRCAGRAAERRASRAATDPTSATAAPKLVVSGPAATTVTTPEPPEPRT